MPENQPSPRDDLRLYRFGKRAHICDLVHDGRLCLNPATTYANNALPMGAFDPGELELVQTMPQGTRFEVFSRDGRPKGTLNTIGSIRATSKLETNYYVFCMSYRYGVDQYTRFDADTCLVFTDPDRFINQACKAIMRRLPGWAVDAGTVWYHSADNFFSLRPLRQDIYYNKPLQNYPQNEIRIVCSPPRSEFTYELERLFVLIGDLHGYTFLASAEYPDRLIESEHSQAWGSPVSCGSRFGRF